MSIKPFTFAAPIATVLSSAPAWAQPGSTEYYGHMWGGSGGMFLGPVFGILIVVALVVAVVLAVRWAMPGGSSTPPASRSPQDILDERYARGEIDKDEYLERKRTLEG